MRNIERYKNFSSVTDDVPLKNKLRSIFARSVSIRKTPVDIILPTFNRSNTISAAIESVLAQLHRNWNLYICDDGSTDNTSSLCEKYMSDKRIKYVKSQHKGVSHARNMGLSFSENIYVAFLDSDNTWGKEYLSLMLTFMDLFSLESAYCAARLIGDGDCQWLGDFFNWEACAELNYIDINCFMLKAEKEKTLFDETLKRLVDWDFILRATISSKVSYLPCSLVNYNNNRSEDRITTAVQIDEAYMSRIRSKYKGKTIKNNIDFRKRPQS